MMIDWFTVIAQSLNFLMLVWLLKRFLYQPILSAIDAREQRIVQAHAEADNKVAEARTERDEFEHKKQELADLRETLVNQMHEEVSAKRLRLLDDAQKAAEALGAKRLETLQREQQALGVELARLAQDQVFTISRSALRDLADASLEERVTKVFISRLRELNGDAKREVADTLSTSSEPVRVRSAFELPREQQAKIRHALNEAIAADISIQFEIEPKGILGIELISNGRMVAWNVDEYLNLMQKSMAEVMMDFERKSEQRSSEVEGESSV